MDTATESFNNRDDNSANLLEKSFINEKRKDYTELTMLNTNARSLCPKFHSMIECMEEMDAAFAIMTET